MKLLYGHEMDYLSKNKEAWDKRTKVHIESEFYDVTSFKNGKCSLNPIELKQVGDVRGKSLLHLQCHFGQDTLSWARLGAAVTGVDLSSDAIKQAKLLNKSLGLTAVFIESDVVQFGHENTQQFDIVFVTWSHSISEVISALIIMGFILCAITSFVMGLMYGHTFDNVF